MRKMIRGCIKINAKGKQLYKFINAVHVSHICCTEQYVRNDVLYAEIYSSDLKKVQNLADEYNIELSTFEYETLSKKAKRYRKRAGFFIGGIIAALLILYFSGIVVSIDIQGNSAVSDSDILTALDELDVRRGTLLKDIDFRHCENQLRLMVDGLSWVGMRRTGNRIVVEVTEITPTPDMIEKRMPCNVVAVKEAQITSVSVYNGQLMRLVGDYVLPGDLLISGLVEDSHGKITKHHAMGKITGIYEDTAVFEETFTYNGVEQTGEKSDEKYMRLLTLDIPLFIGKNDYNSFAEESTEQGLTIFGKKLPISIIRKTVYETAEVSRERTVEETAGIIGEKIYLYENNFLNDVEIIEREITEEQTENSLIYTVKYTLEGEIGGQHDIFVK